VFHDVRGAPQRILVVDGDAVHTLDVPAHGTARLTHQN
jgi:hypothetical protein